jgi:hypothetical protein
VVIDYLRVPSHEFPFVGPIHISEVSVYGVVWNIFYFNVKQDWIYAGATFLKSERAGLL